MFVIKEEFHKMNLDFPAIHEEGEASASSEMVGILYRGVICREGLIRISALYQRRY